MSNRAQPIHKLLAENTLDSLPSRLSVRDDMKTFLWSVGVSFVLLYFLVIAPIRSFAEKERRAELHLLNTIQGQLSYHLHAGGQLPTNWSSLSNAVNWERLAGICEYNQLPSPTELYTVLPHPIDFDGYRSVFLVGSKSRRWAGMDRGRWVLGVCFGWPGRSFSKDDSNHVDRSWISEKHLPPEIRSQLTSNLKH